MILQDRDSTSQWAPTTVKSLGMLEADLENVIADCPDLLLLDASGILSTTTVVFRQLRVKAKAGHTAIPDLVLLTDQGDIIIVEVKLLGNTELRGRAVVSQVVDYAASLSSLAESDLVNLLCPGEGLRTFAALVTHRFPQVRQPAALATRIGQRFREAEILLMIACDRAPESTAQWVRAAGRQSALAFSMQVVEITPHTSSMRPGIFWIPQVNTETRIVRRTTVTIKNESGTDRVIVNVETADADPDAEPSRPKARRVSTSVRSREVLSPISQRLGMGVDDLWAELGRHNHAALGEDWSIVLSAIQGPYSTKGAYLRGKNGYVEGRMGVNLSSPWRPSLFFGAYLLRYDHRTMPLYSDDGGDFAIILDLQSNNDLFSRSGFLEHPEFTKLRRRLCSESTWDCADMLSQPSRNSWHPIQIRKSLSEVLAGTTSEERRLSWIANARDGLQLMLAGGELSRLRDVVRDHATDPQ